MTGIQSLLELTIAPTFPPLPLRQFWTPSAYACWRDSSNEAFLYRRLQSLPETAGRFDLNVELPVPFDGWGNLEVDLLDSKARLVIELDGGQHFADADAYRRDRRKDALLQEQAYFVLRFLVEDVGKRLDKVLDAILRVLTLRDREFQD